MVFNLVLTVREQELNSVEARIHDEFPQVTVMRLANLQSILSGIVDQMAAGAFDWLGLLLALAATAFLANAAGWMAAWGVLNRKPIEILREN